jgi:hypothetical protein
VTHTQTEKSQLSLTLGLEFRFAEDFEEPVTNAFKELKEKKKVTWQRISKVG